MYDKGRRNILLLFANLSCLFVNSSLVYLSFFLVNSYARHSLTRQLVNLSTCQLVNSSTRQPYPIQLELCKKIYKVLLVVIKLLTLRIY